MAGVLARASGKPFRVYRASGPSAARGAALRPLYADAYDDGRVRGYAVYERGSGEVRVVPDAEFHRQYRTWVE